MKNKSSKIIFCAIIFLISITYAQQLTVKSGPINSIKFLAISTLSDFEGTTSAVEGFIRWDSTLTNNSKIELKVFLDSLDTGIGLRNTHMRDNYLETDKYPLAQFIGTITNQLPITGYESNVDAVGILKIHGVEKEEKFTGRFYDYGELYKLECNFTISLPDFNIEQPSFLFTSVDNEITLECIIYLTK